MARTSFNPIILQMRSLGGNNTPPWSSDPFAGQSPAGWQLQSGFYVPRKMDMRVVHPRPESDGVHEDALFKWAHPDIQYSIPIVIQGGAAPHYIELLEGPSGMRAGNFLITNGDRLEPGPEYLRVIWDNPTDAGMPVDGWLVRVAVRDQDYQRGIASDEIIVEWRLKVDPSKFIFISESGNNTTGTGTISQPFEDFDAVYKDDATDNTYASNIIVFRGGDYVPVGDRLNHNGTVRCVAGVKPRSYMGFPGETVNWDMSQSNNWFFDSPLANRFTDITFQNINTFGSKIENLDGSLVKNARNFGFYGAAVQKRVLFDKMTHTNILAGNSEIPSFGDDNPAWVWRPAGFNSDTQYRGSDWAFTRCSWENSPLRTGNGPSCVSLSCSSYVVYEMCKVSNWASTGNMTDKSSMDHISMRFCDLWEAKPESSYLEHGLWYSGSAGYAFSAGYDYTPTNFEVCFSRIKLNDSPNSFALGMGLGVVNGEYTDGVGYAYAYRNNIVGKVAIWGEPYLISSIELNVVSGASATSTATSKLNSGDNDWTTSEDLTRYDNNGYLSSTAKIDNFGTRGADIPLSAITE